MSWSFQATAKTKEALKAYSRKQLLAYHREGDAGHTTMSKVADQIDVLIDLFDLKPGHLLRIDTNGHLDSGYGNLKIELTNYCGVMLD